MMIIGTMTPDTEMVSIAYFSNPMRKAWDDSTCSYEKPGCFFSDKTKQGNGR